MVMVVQHYECVSCQLPGRLIMFKMVDFVMHPFNTIKMGNINKKNT